MSIAITIRPATPVEAKYSYTQSVQLQGQTGCVGHLRADMDSNGEGFFSTWDDHRGYLKTDAFKAEFDQVINRFRFGPGDENGIRKEDDECFLKNRTALAKYCWSQPSARMDTEQEYYGFRADTDSYTYMMRVTPVKGEYNLYCYCYRRDWLEQHMRNAKKGIRFVTVDYDELFRLPDGGKIRISYPDGTSRTAVCRYITDYHVEVSSIPEYNLYHIIEFSERMASIGAVVEPVSGGGV